MIAFGVIGTILNALVTKNIDDNQRKNIMKYLRTLRIRIDFFLSTICLVNDIVNNI